MRVCKHGCDITRILIGYVLADARSDEEVNKQHFPSFVELLSRIFYKSNRGLFFRFYTASSKHSGS